MKARVLTRKCLTIWWKKHLRGGQDGQDLQLGSGQSIESEKESLDLRPWSVWRAALLLLPLYRCVAQARCQLGWGLATLACHQAVGKHSGRFRLMSAPIYFLVGTSSGASKDQRRPIPRCSVNLPWVYISVHPLLWLASVATAILVRLSAVSAGYRWAGWADISVSAIHFCSPFLGRLITCQIGWELWLRECVMDFAGHQMGEFFKWDFSTTACPLFSLVFSNTGVKIRLMDSYLTMVRLLVPAQLLLHPSSWWGSSGLQKRVNLSHWLHMQ